MFVEWNTGHLFLYNGLSRSAQRRIFVHCAALRFTIANIVESIGLCIITVE